MINRMLFSESAPGLGGQELQLLEQMCALRQRGVEVKLACKPDSLVHARAQALGLQTVGIGFRNSLHLPSISRMRSLLSRWRPDVVLSHSGHDANVSGLAARLVSPRPTLLRARTYQHGVPHAWTYNWLADRTLVPSQEMRACILENPRIDPARIHVLYPGLSFENIALAAEQELPEKISDWLLAHPGRVLVHAAMLRAEKAHIFMLDVLAQLLPEFPDLRYVIAGEGEERQKIQGHIAKLKLEEHVLLAGMVQPVASLLKRATLVLMPSLIEPLGMAQIEALSLEIPVVASNVGGIPETITDGQTGLLVTPGNVPAWQEAITWALTHAKQMSVMARAGRTDIINRFSIGANIENLLGHAAAFHP